MGYSRSSNSQAGERVLSPIAVNAMLYTTNINAIKRSSVRSRLFVRRMKQTTFDVAPSLPFLLFLYLNTVNRRTVYF